MRKVTMTKRDGSVTVYDGATDSFEFDINAMHQSDAVSWKFEYNGVEVVTVYRFEEVRS